MSHHRFIDTPLARLLLVPACAGGLALGGVALAEPLPPQRPVVAERALGKDDERLANIEKRLAAIEASGFKSVGGGHELSLNGVRFTISSGGDLRIEGAKSITMRAGTSVNIDAGATASFKGGAATEVRAGANLQLNGAMVLLNGGGKPVALHGDVVQPDPVGGLARVIASSSTVLAK